MIAALLLAIVAAGILRVLGRRPAHKPRALELVNRRLLVERTQKSFATAVMLGEADFKTGKCTRCGYDWVWFCRLGCVREPDSSTCNYERPAPTAMPGPGERRRG